MTSEEIIKIITDKLENELAQIGKQSSNPEELIVATRALTLAELLKDLGVPVVSMSEEVTQTILGLKLKSTVEE
jgi:rRNA-processing protein FCF1